MCVESTTGGGKAARLRAADCLSLAAAPIFALMALLAGTFGGCSGMHGPGLVDGMAVMYALMSVFHAAPWLTLPAIRRASVGAGALAVGLSARAMRPEKTD